MIVLYILSVGTVLIMLLNGWKEIASYLKTSVRTVQRWEFSGLPIARPTKGLRGSVLAYSEQLDQWLLRRSNQKPTRKANGTAGEHVRLRRNLRRAHRLTLQLGKARDQMRSQLQDLYLSVLALQSSRAVADASASLVLSVPKKATQDADPG